MKRAIRLFGVLAIGASAIGCGAEEGSPERADNGEPNIGRVSQALTVKDDIPTARQFAASCRIYDAINDKYLLLVAGGYDSAGSAVSSVYLFDPSLGGGSQWAVKTALTAATGGTGLAVGEAKMIAVPDTDQCVLFGGKQTVGAANAETQVLLYDLSANTWTVKATMPVARANFEVSICGADTGANTDIIVIGGRSGSTFRSAIDKYSLSDTWTSSFATLNAARAYPAVAATNSNPGNAARFQKFLIGAGENSGGKLASVDLLNVANDCTTPDLDAGDDPLTTARSKAVAFFEGTADTFMVCGGTTGTGITDTCEKVSIAAWGGTNITVAGGSAMNVPRSQAELTLADATASKFYVLGGRGLDSTVSTGQLWDTADKRWENDSNGTAPASFDISNSSSTKSRYAFAAQWLDATYKVGIAGGLNVLDGVVTILDDTYLVP